MEAIMSELPLAIFTTCVLLGTGGFAALGATNAPRRAETAEISQRSSGPSWKENGLPLAFLAIIVVGFVAAFFHLASPLHAVFALVGVGRSPLSNEIAAGVIFTGAAALYCIFALKGKLTGRAKRACSIGLGLMGLVFAGFTGAAYLMDTIVTWGTPLSIVESVGLSLFVGTVVLSAFKVLFGGQALSKAERKALLVVAVAGFIIGFGTLGLHVFQTGGLHSSMVRGSSLVHEAITLLVSSAVMGLVSLLLCRLSPDDATMRRGVSAAALVLVVASAFVARLVFYSIQLSVGL